MLSEKIEQGTARTNVRNVTNAGNCHGESEMMDVPLCKTRMRLAPNKIVL